jgi:hypothetical protein
MLNKHAIHRWVQHCHMKKWPDVSPAIQVYSKRNHLITVQKLSDAKKRYILNANTGTWLSYAVGSQMLAN